MTVALWTFADLVVAAEGEADRMSASEITGFSIDTRQLQPGEAFVALASVRDGHDFVQAAFARGASAAIVSRAYSRQPGDRALVRVEDPLKGLENIGRAARSRTEARIVAVTGSAGKTGTKEMLRLCLGQQGLTHAAEKSFNNHWGVPLTLARMPAESRFGIFEIGMNHPGEITPLARMVRPQVAIITTVEAVHLAQFGSVEEIAEAKAEIFAGLEPGGTAIVNRDNAHFDLLRERAMQHGARIVSFGRHEEANVRCEALDLGSDSSGITANVSGRRIAYRLGAPGAHLAINSLAVLAAVDALGADVEMAAAALAETVAPVGRGARTRIRVPGGELLLIDESYNANPASMRAALATMAAVPRASYPRRIVVLGDMLELGSEARRLHEELKGAIDAAGADLVFACGPSMALLYARLDKKMQAAWRDTSEALSAPLLEAVRAGDVVMVKGSFGSRMAPLVEALKSLSLAVEPAVKS